ncbi:hypothetical protein ILUMI_02709 [Ignelater luminosus]|uniref:Jouberin n=1 Tax=Ignelater luminosus TaxID=2038154 RepID=A0A8K0DN91_IGNLU|nr:hypothetical protein ILUMI_02709 [Ignelater luminosus]
MENISKSNISPLHSSVKNETKDKFDALLKEALNSKSRKDARNQSTQKLISDAGSLSSSNENLPGKDHSKQVKSIEIVEVDVHDDNNFILNKFLNDSSKMRHSVRNDKRNVKDEDEITTLNETDGVFIKPPVPRPRKNKQVVSVVNSPSSTGTYKVVKNGEESKSLNTPSKIESDHSISSNVTSVIKGIDKTDSNLMIEENNDLQDKSKTNVNELDSKKESNDKDVSDKISQKSEPSNVDEIKYENEIKSKSKKKQLEKPKQRETFKNVAETLIANQLKMKYSYEKIIAIIIHKTDRLKLDSLVIHPVIKIHLVNSETGEYLHKSDKDRPVVFYYENKNIKCITPVISEPYNLYEKCSLYPAWEETLIINEDVNYLLAHGSKAIIFFEIMDFVTFSVASAQFNQKGTSKGWHKIAWAFFKPLGKNDISNLDKIARLQLYYPGKQLKVLPQVCDIFHWWKNKTLIKYPASLYVSVKSMIPPEKVTETLRSKTPIHGEKASRTTFNTNTNVDIVQTPLPKSICNDKINSNSVITENENEVTWSRSSYQICRLPNKCVAELSSYEEGCLVLKFSKNGLYLACAVHIEYVYWIIVYSVKTYEEICRYSGHQGLIYDINWSSNDSFIVTASADCTVCIWNFNRNTFVEMLPHPSYVYASEINSKNVVATGCYDQIIRIWQNQIDTRSVQYNLMQELEGHHGYITSLCFNNKGSLLYSSDSVGVIIEWKYSTSENSWNLKRELRLADLRNTIINQILLHTRERRLLAHARDSTLRVIDLKTGCVLYWLQGAVNNRFKTICTFSPCGSFVLAGSENGLINIWNSDIGKLVATYTPYDVFNYQNFPIHCVHFHPHDNIIAISHYGHTLPILLAVYDSTIDNKSNIGLKLLQSDDEMEIIKKKSKSRSLASLKSSVEKVITESSTSEKKLGQIKFEDVLNKIDEIVNRHPVSDSSSSINNNNNSNN